MDNNKRIRYAALVITIISLFSLIKLNNYESLSFYYDLSLAVFGSALLTYLTAQISYNSEKRKIKRTVIVNLLQIQAEFKKILSRYSKIVDNWDEHDFDEANIVIRKLIGEFFSFTDTLKFETGRNIADIINVVDIIDIYKQYVNLNGDLGIVSTFVKYQNKESAFEEYEKCRELNKEIVKRLEILLKQEYGKNFSEINSIGLL